jgi:transcription elongation factor Elf1
VLNFLPNRLVRKPRCPVCGQGEVDCLLGLKIKNYVFLCNECDATWSSYVDIFTRHIKDTVRANYYFNSENEYSSFNDPYVLLSDESIYDLISNSLKLELISKRFDNIFFYRALFLEEIDIFHSKSLLFEFNKSISTVFVSGLPFADLDRNHLPFFLWENR